MKLSKNFTLSEFEKSETATRYRINNQVTSANTLANLRALCSEVLQPLRDAWGAPLHVNSGYRCILLNEKVGGAPTSQHRYGEAADIKADDPHRLAKLAKDMKLPYDQMILYPTFVHFSHRRQTEYNRGRILYNWRYKGVKDL